MPVDKGSAVLAPRSLFQPLVLDALRGVVFSLALFPDELHAVDIPPVMLISVQ
jgi:hypothetical protein